MGLALLAFVGWGTVRPRETPAYAHATMFDGAGWTQLTLREKELLVHGFLLGAAAEQALSPGTVPAATAAVSPPGGRARDEEPPSPAASAAGARRVTDEIARLRAEGELRFGYAPSMLARRLDEFYWWRNNREIPLAGALAEIGRRLRTESF
ncbi:MAG: hypothetical protein ABR599_12625 [Gemmatimonadota bacterium]